MSTPSYGGQALLEGVLMRGRYAAAWAVRRPDGSIYLHTEPLRGPYRQAWMHWPFFRGWFVLADALYLGLRAMLDAINQWAERPEERVEGPRAWTSFAFSLAIGLLLFLWFPMLVGTWSARLLGFSVLMGNILEGLFRLGLVVGYLAVIAHLPEVKRLFGYHAAEHQTIHAYEHGAPLTVEAVSRFPAPHPRCGTAFLLMVMVLALVLFPLIDPAQWWARLLWRVLAVPLLVGLSYEGIRLLWRFSRHVWARPLLWPYLALQRLTTRPPEPEMIEVAIAALQALQKAEAHAAEGNPA